MKILNDIRSIIILIFMSPFIMIFWIQHQKMKRKICKYRGYKIETYQCFKTGRWNFYIKGSINSTTERPKNRKEAIKIAKEYIDNIWM